MDKTHTHTHIHTYTHITHTAFLIPVTLIMHPFWKEESAALFEKELGTFLKNTAVLGGLLCMLGSAHAKKHVYGNGNDRRAKKGNQRKSRKTE